MAELREFLDGFFAKGPVPFSEFMQAALYHRDFGYYRQNIRDVGVRGDFSTTVSLSPVAGAAIADWIQREMEHYQGTWNFDLVELGPGDGSLMEHVLEALPRNARKQLKLHLVEVSLPLAELQDQRLRKKHKGIQWHQELYAMLNRSEPRAPTLIFSNAS